MEWNHNYYYHREIIKNLPSFQGKALDIGSGLGLLSNKLSKIFNEVTSIEPDLKSLNCAKGRYNCNNIKYINRGFFETDFDNNFDLITAVSSIHHMDFEKAIHRMKSLLNPNGKIVIIGMYRESSFIDLLYSIAAIVPNFIMNLIGRSSEKVDCSMRTSTPSMNIREIKSELNRLLPSCKFKRHLFWRYSAVFEK